MARTLIALKNEIKDNLVAIAIILSLPPSYSTLQTILMSQDAQSTEDIAAKILAKESCRQETAAQSAFMAKFHSMTKSKDVSKEKKSRQRKKKCDSCKRHHAGKCKKPKADTKEEKPKEAVAKVAQVETSSTDPIQLFVADELAARKHMTHKWIIDSGASAPMSAHRSWFSTYQKLDPPQKVWLGDDRYILAVGEGRIALNMDLGDRTVPAIVQKVLHVLDIQGNLLLVAALI